MLFVLTGEARLSNRKAACRAWHAGIAIDAEFSIRKARKEVGHGEGKQ
jgi:hypothetical protein